MSTAIEFENISKQYRLGLVSTGTLSHDLNRFWQTKVLRREDPYLKVGEVNDRAHKGASEYVWALKDINFKVEQGDVVGIIGRNGAGKSTLLKLLSRVTAPTTGTIRARGRIASLLEVGTGFHPEMTGRENIYMNGAIMGMTRAEITRKLDEIVDFSGCERYLDTPVKRYSSGMTVRLGFAIAAHLEPEILVVDEVLAVGDAEFQKKAIGKMQDVSRGEGRTVLFVSHNMGAVKNLCKRGIVLDQGQVAFDGDIGTAIDNYLNKNKINSIYSRRFEKNLNLNFNFEEIELLVNDRAPSEMIDVFDKITFRLKYSLKNNDDGKCIYFIIEKDQTPLIFLIDTTDNQNLLQCRKKGQYIAEFDLPTPILKAGHYSISLRYTQPKVQDFQRIENCLSFDVSLISRPEYDAGYAQNRDGLIALAPQWRIRSV